MGKLKDSIAPRFRDRACPRDHTRLVAEKVAVRGPDVTIDKCPMCAGVFLDKNELLRISGDFQLNKYLRDKVALDSDSQLVCPHCGGIMDLEHIAGVGVEVCL
ncbi:MAG: zf-TFIIB domain-containing protein, partial [Candidatus Thermoplasmatota archaeon]